MSRRFFLIALVLFLLVVNAAFTQSINSTVFSGGKMLGFLPWWETKESLPCGLFAAASLAIATALGAQFWRGVQPFTGLISALPGKRLRQLTAAGMWCGWPLMAACTMVLTHIFPWAAEGEGSAPFTRTLLHAQLYGSLAAMVLVQLMQSFGGRWVGLAGSVISLPVALSCGLMWWNGHPLTFLFLALLLSPALALLLPAESEEPHPGFWLRLAAALLLLACTAACWFMLARTVLQQHAQLELTYPAMAVSACLYAATLPILAALAWLRCLPSGESGRN